MWSSFSYVASDSRQLDVIVAELQPAHRTPVNDTVREGCRGGWGSGDESRHVFQHQMRVLKKTNKKTTKNKQTKNDPSHPTWTGLQNGAVVSAWSTVKPRDTTAGNNSVHGLTTGSNHSNPPTQFHLPTPAPQTPMESLHIQPLTATDEKVEDPFIPHS